VSGRKHKAMTARNEWLVLYHQTFLHKQKYRKYYYYWLNIAEHIAQPYTLHPLEGTKKGRRWE